MTMIEQSIIQLKDKTKEMKICVGINKDAAASRI